MLMVLTYGFTTAISHSLHNTHIKYTGILSALIKTNMIVTD